MNKDDEEVLDKRGHDLLPDSMRGQNEPRVSPHDLEYAPFSRHGTNGSTFNCIKCDKSFEEKTGWGEWRELHAGEMPELGECAG
jgi:hypothetical protein